MTYKNWMIEVDKLLVKHYASTSNQLPDLPYRDWFDDGIRPDEIPDIILEMEYLQ